MALVNKRRHHTLRIHGVVARLELLSGKDIDRNFLEGQALKPQGNPDTKCSN
jgi:hypothetical protein